MEEKPLMLKDYLELESISESFRWASLQRAGSVDGSGITVRRLLETELGCGGADYRGWRLVRFRSKSVLTKLSAVIRNLQFSTDESQPSAAVDDTGAVSRILSRSFSKKLRRGFWKKRCTEEKEGKVLVKKELDSGYFFYSSPRVSKCSSSADFISSTTSSDLFVDDRHIPAPTSPNSGLRSSPTLSPQKVDGVNDDNRRDQKELCGKDMDCPSEEEKEQLSPVSVMDFPYPDEEEDEEVEQLSATSPCFEKSIASIERTKNQLLQRIRRLESLADLDPQDLDQLFSDTETHDESTVHVATKEERWRRTARSLLRRLNCAVSLTLCEEKLLFDFFVEGLSFKEECRLGTSSGRTSDEELLREAKEWFVGGGVVSENEGVVGGREMEEGSVGWRRFKEEEEVVAVEISCGLLTWLMAELADDLVSAA